jgi:hypothetical protein
MPCGDIQSIRGGVITQAAFNIISILFEEICLPDFPISKRPDYFLRLRSALLPYRKRWAIRGVLQEIGEGTIVEA